MRTQNPFVFVAFTGLLFFGASVQVGDPLAAQGLNAASLWSVCTDCTLRFLIQDKAQSADQDEKSIQHPGHALPDGDGKDTTVRICSQCHSIERFAHQRHDRHDWDGIISSMVGRGLVARKNELDEVSKYLSTYLPPRHLACAPHCLIAPEPNTPPAVDNGIDKGRPH
jgi:cytochrome c5